MAFKDTYHGVFIADPKGNFVWGGNPGGNIKPKVLLKLLQDTVKQNGFKAGQDSRSSMPKFTAGIGFEEDGSTRLLTVARINGVAPFSMMASIDDSLNLSMEDINAIIKGGDIDEKIGRKFVPFSSPYSDESTVASKSSVQESRLFSKAQGQRAVRKKKERMTFDVIRFSGNFVTAHPVGGDKQNVTNSRLVISGEVLRDSKTKEVISVAIFGGNGEYQRQGGAIEGYKLLSWWRR